MAHLQPHSKQRLVELQNETLKRENEMLAQEIVKHREMYSDLKQSLDEAIRDSGLQTTEAKIQPSYSSVSADNMGSIVVSELQEKLKRTDEQLNETVQQLNATRKQLSDVQQRLTVSEQVTIATQRRELQQEGIYETLLTENIYERLRPTASEQHVYAQLLPTSQTGLLCFYSLLTLYC